MDSVTYVSLNVAMLLLAWLVLRRHIHEPRRTYRVILLHMLVLTAVFDTVMIAAGVMVYTETKIIGWHVFLAPIEDFAYTLAAAFGMPALWHVLGRKK